MRNPTHTGTTVQQVEKEMMLCLRGSGDREGGGRWVGKQHRTLEEEEGDTGTGCASTRRGCTIQWINYFGASHCTIQWMNYFGVSH